MTEKSKNSLCENANDTNPALEQLDPSTFEVAAKKHSAMWQTDQYKDESFRTDLLQTFNRIE